VVFSVGIHLDAKSVLNAALNRLLPPCAVVLAACAIAACSTTPPRTAAERVADTAIAEQVEAALAADATIYARHIDVAVNRGVVYLGGYVWESGDFLTARRDAESVPGVKAVDTNMQLLRGGVSGTSR
jgi:osmotically-inducible protein OsmY